MFGDALGLIETYGFVPAVEAADTAVKSADVTLQGCRRVGAGLVTVVMTGDIASVKAAVEAGSASAARLGQVRSATVIGRTGDGLETILVPPAGPSDESPRETEMSPQILPQGGEAQTPSPAPAVDPNPAEETPVAGPAEEAARPAPFQPDLSGIKKMKVSKLRHLARQVEGICLSREEIKFARKKELINAIVSACGRDKE